jgi:hypothetical protein
MTPPAMASSSKGRALSPSSLNKLQAKVLRAKLMGAPDSEKLEREYEKEMENAHGGGGDSESNVRTKVEVLPTLDIRGRLYDVGHGKEDVQPPSGNKRKKEPKVCSLFTFVCCESMLKLSSLRLMTAKLATLFVIMPMMTR